MTAAGVTVGKLLQSRPETLGLDLEILAGSGGLDRRILITGGLRAFGEMIVEAERCHAAKRLADTLEHQLQFAGRDEMDESEIEDHSDAGDAP